MKENIRKSMNWSDEAKFEKLSKTEFIYFHLSFALNHTLFGFKSKHRYT